MHKKRTLSKSGRFGKNLNDPNQDKMKLGGHARNFSYGSTYGIDDGKI